MPDNDDPLISQTWNDIVERDPLVSFSWYLSGRKNCLLEIGQEVISTLDNAFSSDLVDGGQFERAEMLMWLWILGAYEITRTMCQAKECFSPACSSRLRSLKKELAQARMPAAKMEKPRQRTPVISNRSPAEWDLPNRDLVIGDPMSSMLSARNLLKKFEDVLTFISRDDILKKHEDSYKEN